MAFLAKLVDSKNDPLGSYKLENSKLQNVTPEVQAYSVKKMNESHTKLYWVSCLLSKTRYHKPFIHKKSLVLILIGLKKACIHFLKSIYFKYFKMSLLKNVTLFFTIANCLLWYLGWKQFLQNIVQEHIGDPCLPILILHHFCAELKSQYLTKIS